MIRNLIAERNTRGYVFEYLCKCILRKENNNNFIFMVSQFDSIDEILTKYKAKVNSKHSRIFSLMREDWGRFDLIELVFDDKNTRNILDINLYEVKSKLLNSQRDYFDMCLSNHRFLRECINLGYDPKLVSMIIFENWRYSINIIPYKNTKRRIHVRDGKDIFLKSRMM